MSALNLINLNVDTLFEQHSVSEIDIIQKKIQAVVENKREELRTMVGERYRDLLKAADTIAAMQESSGALISQVECITSNCRSLNEQQLIGFKTSEAVDLIRTRSANKQLNNYFSTMVQIKLLTALPELIWSHIDQERFCAAAELFTFSRHVSTGLQLDVHNPMMHSLPVARKQSEILKPFQLTIKQSAIAVLEREELGAEAAADCLLSLLLLDKSNMCGVLKTFLQLRSSAFLRSLTDADREDDDKRRVKQRILASLKVLNGTKELIAKCFLDDGLLLRKLAEKSDPDAPPIIAMMDSNDAQFSYMLPEIISNFRPKFDAHKLEEKELNDAIGIWLEDTTRIANEQLIQLIDLVSSMNTIQELKSDAIVYKHEDNTKLLVEKGKFLECLNFYETKYSPLISQRVRDIIRENWLQATNDTLDSLQSKVQATAESKRQGNEYSGNLLWQDVSADLPLSLAEALSEDRKVRKLLMKTKGYNEDIIDICTAFDKQLESIVADMDVLLKERDTKIEEKKELIDFLRIIAQTQMTDFISKVRNLNIEQGERQRLLLIVHFLSALMELCPNLKICFCQQSTWRHHLGHSALVASDDWLSMCRLIEEEVLRFWSQISEGILEETNCSQYLPKEIDHEVILEDFANWETINIEQKDLQDNPLNSTFRIPSQPRISLQSYLSDVIRSLNINIPQTLPIRVLHMLNKQLLTQLLQHYETLGFNSQNVALQLYFDVKFLFSIFAVSREHPTLADQFQSLVNKLKESIDPFDFELFADHISVNIKKSVSRLSCLLGVLSPNAVASVASSTSNVQEQDPNVLSLSSTGSTSIWFPLLPIIDSGSSECNTGIEDRSKDNTSENENQSTPTRKSTTGSRKSDTTKSKSGAAAFFGAMSQEWFR